MKKILVLVADYPNNLGGVALMFVHVRNQYYVMHDIDVTVLNFASKVNYEIDGIKVITLESYKKSNVQYEIAVVHAANIRNHYNFLKRYNSRFKRMIFFFHGHEILMINKAYPAPFEYIGRKSEFGRMIQNIYDCFKFRMWHRFFIKNMFKIDLVFVSRWLYNQFKNNIKISEKETKGHIHIINNSIGKIFEDNSYDYKAKKKYDFITIRSNMDDSKYCIDLVDQLAQKYRQYKFLIIGKGEYYRYYHVPENVTWINTFLNHHDMMKYIDLCRCGLLLTREDTQGVMTCELAEYGIPVITSNIDVCKEICDELCNVELISNDINSIDLSEVYDKLIRGIPYKKHGKFNYENTVYKEEKLIKL